MHLHSHFSKEYLIEIDGSKGKTLWYEKIIQKLQRIFTSHKKYQAEAWSIYFRSGFYPDMLYTKAMQKGMDFFCLTDHDTIDGWKELLKEHPELKPRVIPGVELTCYIPGNKTKIHVNIFNLNEKNFLELKKISGDIKKVTEYCKKNKIICSLNHWNNSSLQNFAINKENHSISKSESKYLWNMFRVVEARNGLDREENNKYTQINAMKSGKSMLAGSDSHVGKVGMTWTEVPGARTKNEFLKGIIAGNTKLGGRHGTSSVLKDEARIQARTYSGLYYTDYKDNMEYKLDLWYRGFLRGLIYSSIEKTIKAMIIIFSRLAVSYTFKDR